MRSRTALNLSWRNTLGVINHVVDSSRKLLHTRARHDNRIPATMRFLGDPKKLAAVIFAEFDVEMLALDLQFPGLYEVIHLFAKTAEFRTNRREKESRKNSCGVAL